MNIWQSVLTMWAAFVGGVQRVVVVAGACISRALPVVYSSFRWLSVKLRWLAGIATNRNWFGMAVGIGLLSALTGTIYAVWRIFLFSPAVEYSTSGLPADVAGSAMPRSTVLICFFIPAVLLGIGWMLRQRPVIMKGGEPLNDEEAGLVARNTINLRRSRTVTIVAAFAILTSGAYLFFYPYSHYFVSAYKAYAAAVAVALALLGWLAVEVTWERRISRRIAVGISAAVVVLIGLLWGMKVIKPVSKLDTALEVTRQKILQRDLDSAYATVGNCLKWAETRDELVDCQKRIELAKAEEQKVKEEFVRGPAETGISNKLFEALSGLTDEASVVADFPESAKGTVRGVGILLSSIPPWLLAALACITIASIFIALGRGQVLAAILSMSVVLGAAFWFFSNLDAYASCKAHLYKELAGRRKAEVALSCGYPTIESCCFYTTFGMEDD